MKALGAWLPLHIVRNKLLAMTAHIVNNQLCLGLHRLPFAGRTVKCNSYVGIHHSFRMRSLWVVMRQMFEPLRTLDESCGTRLTVEGFYVFVLLSNMIEHRVLLLAYLGTVRAHILTERILDVFCRHSWT